MLDHVRVVALAVLALTLVACGPIDGTATADRPMSAGGSTEEHGSPGVVDGDTIHASVDGDDVTIRPIGVHRRLLALLLDEVRVEPDPHLVGVQPLPGVGHHPEESLVGGADSRLFEHLREDLWTFFSY